MIKIELEDEQIKPSIRVIFGVRRHQKANIKMNENLLFLTSRLSSGESESFPIRIDGDKREVIVRKSIFEFLGFKVYIED